MNPYTRIGYGNSTDEEGDFKPAPSNSYGTKDTGKTKRRNPYTSVGFGDEETRGSEPTDEEKQIAAERKKKEEEKKNRNWFSKGIDQINILDSGKSWKNDTPSAEQADKSLATQVKEVGSGFFSGVEKVGDSVEALTGIADRRLKHWDEQLKAGKITKEQYSKLQENFQKDTAWAGTEDKGLGDRFKKSAAVAAEATSEIVPFMKAGKAAQLTTKGGAGFGAATGAAHGIGSEGTNPEGFDIKRAALETGIGLVGGAAGGKLAQWSAAKKATTAANKETTKIFTEMDEAATKLSQELDKAKATGSKTKVQALEKQENYLLEQAARIDRDELISAKMSVKKDGFGDFKSDMSKMTPEDAAIQQRLKERPANLQAIEQGQNLSDSQRLAMAGGDTGQAGLPSSAGQTKTSSLGKRTEALAIEKKLSEGFDSLPTYQTTNLADEAATVIEHMDRDMEGATRIALGIDPPPPGATAGSYYVGLANRAAKTGDADLIRRIGTESSVASKASRMGQEISALQNLDPESPITAVKNVLKARTKGQPQLPATISIDETKRITELSKVLSEAKDAAINGGDKMAYGKARIAYDNYVADLVANSGPTLKEAAQRNPAGFAKDAVLNAAGLTKSMVATLDNSVIGRQGWKTLMTSPKTWAKNSLKSFKDIAKTYGGKNVLDEVHADVVARDNALNGMYKAMKLDVYGAKKDFLEEAFPVSISKLTNKGVGEKLSRPFKASEAAFSAWQQRTRVDLADQYLTLAKNMGVDLTSKKEVEAIGRMVNSLTSRGHLGKSGEKWADGLNKVFFAPRLVKSHVDVLGGHILTGAGGSNFVRKQAAKNLLKIAVGSAMALKLASAATGGSVETDPRSSNFGKVKVGDTRFDMTGGMAGLLTLGSRLITQESKSSSTGEVKKLNTGEFGSQNTYDVLLSFGENKLSPIARSATDFLKGEDFDGKKPTVGSTVKNLTIPLILRQYEEVANAKNGANVMATMISEALGISANTYGMDKDWNADKGKQVNEFKSKVSSESFKKANDDFNSQFTDWYTSVSADDRFWKLPQDQRLQLVTNKKRSLTDEVMAQYGYKYQQPKKNDSEKALMEELKKYQK